MKKQRRRRATFTFYWRVETLCYPNQVKRMHDKLHKVVGQAVADYLDEPLMLTDCKTGKFKGSVRPRR